MRGGEVEQWVAEGKLDVGVLTRPPSRTDLDVTIGLESPYLIVATPQPQRAWHEFGYIAARQFSPDPSPVEGCASEQHLGGPWPEGNFARRIVAETDYMETALSLCLAGVGAAFLPEIAVRRHLAAGQLAVVAEAPADYHERLYVVWRKGVTLLPELRETLGTLESTSAIA
jgi:DNA-binding transcriptional LysR family regulator